MFVNIAAYKFVPLTNLADRRQRLRTLCNRLKLKGSILLSVEGINLFLAGTPSSVDEFLDDLKSEDIFADIEVKESKSQDQPFNRMLVKIKEEIIAFGVEGIDPVEHTSPRISPRELRDWYERGVDFVMLDVRNQYEIDLGTFVGALSLEIDHFRDYPKAISSLAKESDEDKHRPIVTFCTGGIRCEKAAPLLEREGFTKVFQLDGGILKYFEECGGTHYDGDCFVFDQRVALNSQLQETETTQCYACQSPLTPKDQESSQYVPGRSCPSCFQSPDEQSQQAIHARNLQLAAITTPLPGSQPYTNRRPLHIPQHADGKLLLDYLRSNFGFVDPDAWIERFERGLLVLDRQPVSIDHVVAAGERYEHWFPDTVEPDVNPNIRVLYEDAAIVVVNKPAPLPMHPCGRFNRNSLSYLLGQAYKPQQLRLAHRLDANTSGVVVFSRKRQIAGIVQEQFAAGTVGKRYVARVDGHPPTDVFESDRPISSRLMPAGARSVSEADESGLEALTRFRVLRRCDDGTTMIEARPITGRTNQIRIHLWDLGWPILGDPMYLADRAIQAKQTLTPSDPPLCLHAFAIEFDHPVTQERVEFEAPLPEWCSWEVTNA